MNFIFTLTGGIKMTLLATIGAGLAWFATTFGQLIMWGAGIGTGFWVSHLVTDKIDLARAKVITSTKWNKLFKKFQSSNSSAPTDEEIAGAAAIATS